MNILSCSPFTGPSLKIINKKKKIGPIPNLNLSGPIKHLGQHNFSEARYFNWSNKFRQSKLFSMIKLLIIGVRNFLSSKVENKHVEDFCDISSNSWSKAAEIWQWRFVLSEAAAPATMSPSQSPYSLLSCNSSLCLSLRLSEKVVLAMKWLCFSFSPFMLMF